MVALGEGRSPMTSSDAEMDFIPIIIIIILDSCVALHSNALMPLGINDFRQHFFVMGCDIRLPGRKK